MTERASMTLVWLQNHKRPGTPRSRAYVRRHFTRMLFTGLRRAGVYGPFMCLHRYEGAWDSNTGNGYTGGLQFDTQFAYTYGGEYIRAFHGLANVWPVALQMNAAYRAERVRGYSPWGTRALCGL